MTVSPSRSLCVWVATVSVCATILCVIYLPAAAALVIGAIVLGVAIVSIRRDGLLVASDAVVALRFGAQGLRYQCRNGVWHDDQTERTFSSGFVSRWFVLVAVQSGDVLRWKYILLFPDSLDADAARRMRIWLLWSRQPDGDR